MESAGAALARRGALRGWQRPPRQQAGISCYGMARDGYANTWRYRDWVIQALNEDMPYNQFVKAQIAADLVPEKDRSKMLPALGFFWHRTLVYR